MVSGARKGSAYERTLCRQFSLWITNGKRDDIFWRNISSGAQFTSAARRGKQTGIPGDMKATDPLGYPFLAMFMVEFKHHKNIHLEQYIFDKRETSPLAKIITKARAEASSVKLEPLVVAKQNQREAMVFVAPWVGYAVRYAAHPMRAFSDHVLHNGAITMIPLSSFLLARPSLFLARVEELNE